VESVLTESRRAVVKLTAVACTGQGLRGGGAELVRVGTGEAERWFREAESARGSREAARCVERAAKLGHVEAMCRLAELHEKGEGVPVDEWAALGWCRKAADRGHARAMHDLGVKYEEGAGVPKDAVAAVSWYRKAAALGEAVAMCSLVVMCGEGGGCAEGRDGGGFLVPEGCGTWAS
jgi:TPR repeat protein